jgi:hypothetical protein
MIDDEHEWRCAVNDMTEMDRAVTDMEVRSRYGLSGDREDARD